MRARDNHGPEKTTDVTVLIKVNRNNHLPIFQGQPYDVTLSENKGVGQLVYHTVARDKDKQVRLTLTLVAYIWVNSI